MICHILEGTNAGSSKAYMACGRALTYPGKIGRYVGRAWVLKGVWCDPVTCKQCRKKYKLPMGESEEEAR